MHACVFVRAYSYVYARMRGVQCSLLKAINEYNETKTKKKKSIALNQLCVSIQLEWKENPNHNLINIDLTIDSSVGKRIIKG